MKGLEGHVLEERETRRQAIPDPPHILAAHAVDAMLEKKAYDVTVMDMRNVSGFADWFVICTGDSDLQVKAVTEEIRMRIRNQCGESPWHTEGADTWQWVLLDYVDMIAHVFSPAKRAFYDLERLWGDAPRERVAEASSAAGVEILRPPVAEGAPDRSKAGGGR